MPYRGGSGWAGPDADAARYFGRRRVAGSGPCEPETTHQIWRSSEKGSTASLKS